MANTNTLSLQIDTTFEIILHYQKGNDTMKLFAQKTDSSSGSHTQHTYLPYSSFSAEINGLVNEDIIVDF